MSQNAPRNGVSSQNDPIDTPHARRIDKEKELREALEAERAEDDLVDEGLEETFPASDPVSPKHIT